MTASYKDRSSLKVSLVELAWRLLALVALAGCTVLGWFLFELTRQTDLDNYLAEIYRTVTLTLQAVFRLDPVLTLIVFPFAVVVILILIGLLIWMQKDR